MSNISYKPTSAGRRAMTSQDFSEVTAVRKNKSLLGSSTRDKGRNNQGRITSRHRGGGAKRFYRQINYNLPNGFSGVVEAIEYDPNRTARIALLKSADESVNYVIATKDMQVGDKIVVSAEAPISLGNRLQLNDIPVGTTISLVELSPGQGARLARSAGASVQLMAKEGEWVQLRLPSNEIRLVHVTSMATVGPVGNENHQNVSYGKAGRIRRKGWRPKVRGVAMGAYDHPHGGGDGGRHGTGKPPRTPWGMKTLGYKTRKRQVSNSLIIKRRQKSGRA